MVKTLKAFGVYCAIESVVAVTFLIAAGMCLSVEAIDGVVVALLVSGGALGLGMLRYRKLTAPQPSPYAPETVPFTAPKRNRAKPAPAKPRKVTKRAKAKK